MEQRIVSIGFLTESDLQRLGKNFTKCFPIAETALFDDLIEKLDRLPPVTQGSRDQSVE